jgi:hypothetical protein
MIGAWFSSKTLSKDLFWLRVWRTGVVENLGSSLKILRDG